MILPELQSIAVNGSVRFWRISVNEGWYKIEYGLKNGKTITKIRNCIIKNIGKKNETTLFEQTLNEAKSKWNKKKDEGYFNIEIDNKICSELKFRRQSILPMLAQTYNPTHPTIDFPCKVQPKLDGIRALYYGRGLWSRKGKLFKELNHIVSQLSDVNIILDGELYSYDLSFQEINSAVKKSNVNTLKIMYIVYDIINDLNFPERFNHCKSVLSKKNRPNVCVLDTYDCTDSNDVLNFMEIFIKDKYEGLILRNLIGSYVPKHRSKTLQKYKEFIDDEFEIIGFSEGMGSEQGLILFECACKTGQKFKVRPIGTHEIRRNMYSNGSDYIGKMLSVKYQELTDGCIPRFPVGIAIRDYE